MGLPILLFPQLTVQLALSSQDICKARAEWCHPSHPALYLLIYPTFPLWDYLAFLISANRFQIKCGCDAQDKQAVKGRPCLSFLYGFHCHNHLKQGLLDSYLKNETRETDLERTVVRNGLSDELKIQLLGELKPQLDQVMNGGVYVERLINTFFASQLVICERKQGIKSCGQNPVQ